MVAILHIYEAEAILLLFCDDQDNESEWWEIEIIISKYISIDEKYQWIHATKIYTLYKIEGQNCGNYSYLWF